MQGGDEVEVLLALLVVEEDALLEGFDGCFFCNAFFYPGFGEFGGDFEGVEGGAGVSAGVGGDGAERFFVGGDVHAAQAAFGVGEGALEKGEDLVFGEGLEGVDAAAGEQRRNDLKGRVLGGGSDEADGAVLDVGEEGVLLGLVEAVDLVDEEDGAGAEFGGFFGVNHDLLDLLYAGEDGGELDEAGAGDVGDDAGEGGLADSGRSPEDHRGGVVALDLDAEGLAGGEDMLLADVLIEVAGAHAVGERGGDGCSGGEVGGRVKEAHKQGSGNRAQGTERRAQSTGLRAQSSRFFPSFVHRGPVCRWREAS